MRRFLPTCAILVALISFITAPVSADAPTALKLPAIFGDNAVLQRDKPVPVWGWAVPGDIVTVSLGDQKKNATAADDGKWMVKLDPLKAGGPHDLSISAKSGSVTFKNILIGEVWLCSGQSNMEWPLSASRGGPEAAKETTNPNLRLFTVRKKPSDEPVTDVIGSWSEPNEKTSLAFSGVAFFFGRELQSKLDVPVGLIHSSWGGTAIQLWQSEPALAADPDFEVLVKKHEAAAAAFPAAKSRRDEEIAAAKAAGKTGNDIPKPLNGPGMGPGSLYNGMIAPLVPYALGGAIWYQGESNAGQADLYRKQMPAMIGQWRKDFGGEFPFLITQLANYLKREEQPTDPDWAYLRESQSQTVQNTPKTGMAVIIDIGEANDIHPRNKEDVGKRLALAALAIGYNQPIVYSGPVYDSMKVEGDQVRLKFKHVGGGLVGKDGDALKGFAIAGEDRKFVWADAKLDGDSILVSSKDVPKPIAVRYGWANNPDANLYNKEGLPASPFRTDQWPRAK